jgi:hypothetical protein
MPSFVGMRRTFFAILVPMVAIPVAIPPSPVSSLVSFPPFISSSVVAVTVPSWAGISSIAIVSGISVPRTMGFSRGTHILPISGLRIARPLSMFSVYAAIAGSL